VWSASVDNPTSLRVAEKLGFERIGQMVYVIPMRA
jgi:RimJ/RimL family protein N-acetyltransferase